MTNKAQVLNAMVESFNRWQDLLASLDQKQINIRLVPSDWTVKDIVAHLWAWQQGSVARMQAALQDGQPVYPDWWLANGPDPEEDIDRTNAWIFKANQERTWTSVYTEWKAQFQRYIELTKLIPEPDLLQPGRFTWMGSYAIVDSCLGSIDHHQEHLETLQAWLKDQAM